MLNLPAQTEINKSLPKSAIFQKLLLNTPQKESFERDISRIYIANELSERTLSVARGETIDAIFVLLVHLKKREYTDKNITMLSKMIERNIVYAMKFEEEYQLAIYHTKLIKSTWTHNPDVSVAGLNLDAVWENFVRAIRNEELGVSSCKWDDNLSLADNIAEQEEQAKILKQIDLLEKKMRNTKQFNEQVKIKNEIKKLKEELGVL